MQISVLKAFSLTWVCFFFNLANAECPPPQTIPTPIKIARITDGDSIVLTTGIQVRLIGINTPEVTNKKYNQQGQPFGQRAKQILTSFLKNQPISGVYGTESKDRYQRHLLHLYDADGKNINARMLQSGAARLATTPPNLSQAECYKQMAHTAQQHHLGLWSLPSAITDASSIQASTHPSGFITVQGRITHINQTLKSFWLKLTPKVSIRIAKKNWQWFDLPKLKQWVKQTVIVNGYYHWHDNQAIIMLNHPSMITLNNTEYP